MDETVGTYSSIELDDDRMHVMKVITAFFAGAATGAAVALLYAPNDGRRTRDLVGDKVQDLANKIKAARWRAVDKVYKSSEAALPEVGVWPGTPAEASGEESVGGKGGNA